MMLTWSVNILFGSTNPCNERSGTLRNSGVNSEQNDTGLFEGAPTLNGNPPEVLIGEEAHLSRNRKGLVFVGQIAGVRQAGENVISRQSG